MPNKPQHMKQMTVDEAISIQRIEVAGTAILVMKGTRGQDAVYKEMLNNLHISFSIWRLINMIKL